jgi:uncharacterized protein YecT (DUF1311 family)
LLTFPIAPVAQAQTVDCAKAMTTVELNYCAERSLIAADAKLNAAHKKALKFITSSGGDKPYDGVSWEKALRASQTAWIAFRDADCKGLVPLSRGGGTGTTSAILGCLTSKTEARTAELIALSKGD